MQHIHLGILITSSLSVQVLFRLIDSVENQTEKTKFFVFCGVLFEVFNVGKSMVNVCNSQFLIFFSSKLFS